MCYADGLVDLASFVCAAHACVILVPHLVILRDEGLLQLLRYTSNLYLFSHGPQQVTQLKPKSGTGGEKRRVGRPGKGQEYEAEKLQEALGLSWETAEMRSTELLAT